MRHVAALSEDQMVAAFLQAEIESERFRARIDSWLRRAGCDRRIVIQPDLANAHENALRLKMLGDVRGYRQDRELFRNFPGEVSWHRYLIDRQELARVRYIDYSYWRELSGGSRLPADAARNIRGGLVVFGQSSQRFLDAASALKGGAQFPEMILVGTSPGEDLVVLEGHLRLTAYFLSPELIPSELQVIVGFSPALESWMAL